MLTAIAVTASLAACSGTGAVVPLASQQSPGLRRLFLSTAGGTQGDATGSPCLFKGIWDLHGACLKYAMQPKGTTVALGAYDGITVTMVWPSPMPTVQPNSFVSGDATGNKDITGSIKNKPFPKYGSVKCIDPYFHYITCTATAFLYTVTANTSSLEIGFRTTAKVRIINVGPYPGTKCKVANLEVYYKKWVWQILNMPYARPVGNALTIRVRQGITFASGSVDYMAYACK